MRGSTRLFLMGAILVAVGAGLFGWGATTSLQPAQGYSRADVMALIGQFSGALAGVGVVLWLFGIFYRLRGR